MSCKTECFANSYFSYTIKEWNNLSLETLRSVSTYEVFKNLLLKVIAHTTNTLINVSGSLGIKRFSRLSLRLSRLRGHSNITLSQDDHNLDPPLLTHLFVLIQF